MSIGYGDGCVLDRQMFNAEHLGSLTFVTVAFQSCIGIYPWVGMAQSVQRLATAWTVRGSNPGGGEIFRIRPDRPWGPPSLLYNGYRVFPGGKAAGAWR